MFEEHFPTTVTGLSQATATSPETSHDELRSLLLGDDDTLQELPALPDLIAGVIAMSNGTRRKVMLPLSNCPAEFALVRQGSSVHIDCYTTESAPEQLVRHRSVPLGAMLRACVAAGERTASEGGDTTSGRAFAHLVRRLSSTPITTMTQRAQPVHCTGGSLECPDDVALAFGFEAAIMPPLDQPREAHAFADVHSMLFDGELWTFHAGQRRSVARGPILLTAQRMVRAVRAMVDAWQAERNMHVRLNSGGFAIGLRLQRGVASLTLTTVDGQQLSWQALDVPAVALPILRLASDLVRRLIAVDRSQTHNLRVTALRGEVRQLRRMVRSRNRIESFENLDPERLRISSPAPEPTSGGQPDVPHPGRLRYAERWSAEIDGLDASSIFLCGERLIVAGAKLTFALDRNDGDVVWSTPTARAASMLAGQRLLRMHDDGELELCDVRTGNVEARTQLSPRVGAQPRALFVGGGDLPPMAVITEGHESVVAVDLRTGEPRFRFRCRGEGTIQLRAAGRVLLVTSGDSAIDAIDIGSGEVVWRYSDRVRFCLPPAVIGDVVVAPSGEPGGGGGAVYGIDLFMGRLRFQHELPAAPSADPIATDRLAVVAYGGSRQARLSAFDPRDGQERWVCHDPGLDNGGCALQVDDRLLVNTPRGRLSAIDLDTGETRYSLALSNPLTDDVPRRLMPRLRQGALFVPSAQVHVVRPQDGATLTSSMACDLVPDYMAVDERGHLYVAEESGHLRAYAPGAHLSLVR